MALETEFIPLELDGLHAKAEAMRESGKRFIQTHAVNGSDGIDLYYSFMVDGKVVNYRIAGVKPTDAVPSITDVFLAAFVFENEARELFGVDMHDIALDFKGTMYAPAQDAPMTFISPEQLAARQKARKAQAGESPKPESKPSAPAAAADDADKAAKIEEKLAGLDPEKAAKVRAALEAKAKREAEGSKAAKAAKGEKTPMEAPATQRESAKAPGADSALEAHLSSMDPDRAAAVRAAFEAHAQSTGEGGE